MAKTVIGRNAPCPCGSGKKFKKCCNRPANIPPTVSQAKPPRTPPPEPSTHFLVSAQGMKSFWADARGQLLVFLDASIPAQLIKEFFPQAQMLVLGMGTTKWRSYALTEPNHVLIRDYTDGQYLLKQRLEVKALESMEERCGGCPACLNVDAAKRKFLPKPRELGDQSTFDDGLVQMWNQTLVDNPCQNWSETQLKNFYAGAASISESIRPRVPELT